MTTKEALDKVTNICFSHLLELQKEEEAIKENDKLSATALAEEQKQLSKAVHIVGEYFSNLINDGK